jgi:hypothetical protein
MYIDIDSKELVRIISEIEKRRPKSRSKKFTQADIELYFLAGLAIFIVDTIELSTPAIGSQWRGRVVFPKIVLIPYIKNPPKVPTVRFSFEDGKIQIENFKIKAQLIAN